MVANKIVICISVLISTSCAQMNVDDKLEETQVTLKRLDVDRNTIPLCLLSWNLFQFSILMLNVWLMLPQLNFREHLVQSHSA